MENEGGRSVRSSSPLFALVTQFLVTSQWSGFLTRESKKMRESWEKEVYRIWISSHFFFSSFRKGSLSLFFDGHAFPKTVYNIFSYACAVVRANARPPLGFFELLLGLFLNKLVFLFVRTGAELEASPVDGATGEYENIERGVITTTCSCYFYPFLSSLQILLEMHFFCMCICIWSWWLEYFFLSMKRQRWSFPCDGCNESWILI